MVKLYAIQCDVFPKNKIIKILKLNDFHFSPQNSNSIEDIAKYLSYSEDKMYFIGKAIVLNHLNSAIIIGNTFREDMNESAFRIYFPNQIRVAEFNYNPEFSKTLLTMDDFSFDQTNPIVSINLHKKNIDKTISGYDIRFQNTHSRNSKKFKPVNFSKIKSNGIEKLFLYKQNDYYIIIGWVLQGRRNRNTIIYNKSFTQFLMSVNPFEVELPKDVDHLNINKDATNTKKDTLKSNNDVSEHDLKQHNNPWQDRTPNIDHINKILDKISKSGIKSLSVEEITFLDNDFGNV